MEYPGRQAGGDLGSYAYTGERGEQRSFADVVKDIIATVQELIRSEVRLAKAEFREEAGKAMAAGKMIAVGGVLALFAVGFILLTVMFALENVVANWAAALIVGVAVGVVAGVLLLTGKQRFTQVSPTPEKTIESVKENVEWMKNQTK
jgi:uncharacterized membrane protein YqjE